jgi:chemotaxis protein methyltransferase CheR
MYFEPEVAQTVVMRIARSMLPGGYLFLGHAETLRNLSHDFHLEHTHATFYYRRRTGQEDRARGREEAALQPVPPLSAIVERAQTWVEAIRSSSDRILELTRPPMEPPAPAGPRQEKAGWDLRGSLELLQKDQFGDAWESVQTLPPESARDPEVLLLRAVLLTHSGQLEGAEAMCHQLLEIDEFNSGAHYLLALCREGVGDRRAAVEQDQIAVYLDPSFAMPRLHLGLIARRAGDAGTARREFGDALLLLQREDTSRLVLFGGGFGREALIALCRAEIVGCGGRTP